MNSPFALNAVRFAWPDDTVVFDRLTTTVPPGRTGLVGSNGSGKSTLLRLLAGALTPTDGTISRVGSIGYLPQDLVLQEHLRVDEHLGIVEVRRAIAAIEAGDTDPAHLETIGDDWDAEPRAIAELARLGLPEGVLDRHLHELSGGECTRLALAAVLLEGPEILLLDEPTNNLDRQARGYLYDLVASWPGTLVVVSHDRELLNLVDRIGEVRPAARPDADRILTWYGGNYSAYRSIVEAEQAAAEHAVTAARSAVRRQQSDLIAAHVTVARRERYGRKMSAQKREPKIVMNQRRREAQASATKLTGMHTQRLADAQEHLDETQQLIRRDEAIRIDLPGTEVPAGRQVLDIRDLVLRTGASVELAVRGPERIAVVGPNGSGKTTLLQTICGSMAPTAGEVQLHVPARLLPQRIDILDPDRTVLQNAAEFAPSATENLLRARLARFLFRGDSADRTVAGLSGGEQFRAALACLMLAEPVPQLLILDEPTNNLDLASVEQLAAALDSYRGALLIASHDAAFLSDIGVTGWVELSVATPESPGTPEGSRSAP